MLRPNNFENLFDGDISIKKISSEKFDPIEIIDCLMHLTSQVASWWSIPSLRMMVVKNNIAVSNYCAKMMETSPDNDPGIDVGRAAFMMILSDILQVTCDQYGSDEEKEDNKA